MLRDSSMLAINTNVWSTFNSPTQGQDFPRTWDKAEPEADDRFLNMGRCRAESKVELWEQGIF